MRSQFPIVGTAVLAPLVGITMSLWTHNAIADTYQVFNVSGSLQSGASFSGTVTLDTDPADGTPYISATDITVSGAYPALLQKVLYQGAIGEPWVEDVFGNSDSSAQLVLYLSAPNGTLLGYNGGPILPSIHTGEPSVSYSAYSYTPPGSNGTQDDLDSGYLSSASCSGDASEASCSSPNIYFVNPADGKNDEIEGTSATAVVGEQIQLFAEIPPSLGTIASGKWVVQGKPIGGFTATPNSYNQGKEVPITDDQSSITLYWPASTEGMSNDIVKYEYTLTNGQTGTLKTSFDVTPAPTAAVSVVEKSAPVPCEGTTRSTCDLYRDTDDEGKPILVMGFGNVFSDSNLGFEAQTLTNPGSGKFQWVQVVLADQVEVTYPSGSTSTCTYSPGLDKIYPYPAPSVYEVDDSPSLQLKKTESGNARYFTAQMYLMWTSNLSGSIPVPLGSVVWGFQESSQANPSEPFGWETPVISSYPGQFSPSASYPLWNRLASEQASCGSVNQ